MGCWWAQKYRNNEVEQIQQAHALSASLSPSPGLLDSFIFFVAVAIFLYLNEQRRSLSRDGAGVIHHRQDTCGEGGDEDRTGQRLAE